MPRVPPFDRPATYDDLLDVPDNLVAEIVDGELHASPRPAPSVAGSANVLGGTLVRGLGSNRGAESWQVLPGAELHLGADVLFPGLAGWRRARLPELPAAPYFSIPPDWVCEIVSSSTASLRARKMAIYAGEGVSHAWLIDPVAHTLEVRRVEEGRWTVVAAHVGEAVVRAEPFEEVELRLGTLWPHDSDDRRTKRR